MLTHYLLVTINWVNLLVIALIVGLVIWFVNRQTVIPYWLKVTINVVAAIIVLLLLVRAFRVPETIRL